MPHPCPQGPEALYGEGNFAANAPQAATKRVGVWEATPCRPGARLVEPPECMWGVWSGASLATGATVSIGARVCSCSQPPLRRSAGCWDMASCAARHNGTRERNRPYARCAERHYSAAAHDLHVR